MYAMRDMSTTMESDRWFKSVPEDAYESTDGNVEAPTNWFGLLRVDDATRDYVGSETGDTAPASIVDGLYLVSIDSNGLVWAEQADTESATRANYAELAAQYVDWYVDDEAVMEQAHHDRHGL